LCLFSYQSNGSGENTGYSHARSLRKDKRAVAPAVSTVIMTAAVIVMILVAMSSANNFLDSRMAENEFSTNKQFMLTTGLQIDDIAWTIGRAQTVRYSSQYGNMRFQSPAVNYTFEVYDGVQWTTFFNITTGMIMFNIPVTTYSIGNNHFERMLPASNGSFLQEGPSAAVSQVFCIEKLPMDDGSYIRMVAVPAIRMLNSTISGPLGTSTNYAKFYLPILEQGNHRYLSQSITMTGIDIVKMVHSGVNSVRITAAFPNAALGFDSAFFNFDNISETVTLSAGSVVEFYIGHVIVTLGQV
jgi:hypothetical protein